MEPVLLYITTPNREEAISLSRELVSSRLVACTNIIDHMMALYWWQGEIEHTAEVIVIAKTVASQAERVIAKVKELHSQSCPCILTLPVTGGNPEYIAWLQTEARGEKA